jgi:hypothetical protein
VKRDLKNLAAPFLGSTELELEAIIGSWHFLIKGSEDASSIEGTSRVSPHEETS